MRLYTSLCSRVLFPLHERLKGHTSVAVRDRLERSQWLPTELILTEQARRLRAFLVDIGQRVPYYRSLFSQLGFDPTRVVDAQDLQILPLTGKPEMRAAVDTLRAEGHGPLTRYNTGGSSGEPLIFYTGLGRKSHDVAAKWRATRWWGVDIGDPELVVWGSPIELGAQDRIRRWRDAALRSHLLPAFEMSPVNLGRYVARIRALRPAMLFGYPSSLALIASHARSTGQRVDDLGIRVAFVTSEKLYPEQRDAISEVFGCPVANGYGARDAGFIAHECPQGRLHISAEDIVVETIRPDGSRTAAGEAGEIVVTHLATEDYPLVRYRTGDIGVLSAQTCPCGRGLPVLAEVQGRTTDFVVAADGTVMHGLALIYCVRDVPGVRRFRIEQMSLDYTHVWIEVDPGFDRAHDVRMAADLRARLGAGVRVDIERVDTIPTEGSGKFRYVVSRVKPNTQMLEPVSA